MSASGTASAGGIRVGIDASNLRDGGGITHLTELLRHTNPDAHGIGEIIVWCGKTTADRLDIDESWLLKRVVPVLNKRLPRRAWWQRFTLSRLAREARCDVLFVPGGSFAGDFRPVVTMSRNMLPFEWRELRRYGFTRIAARLLMLRLTQGRTFRRAQGLIFLTAYAQKAVLAIVGRVSGTTAVIPHGVRNAEAATPRDQLPMDAYHAERPFRILYVSIVDVYKHQPEVVEAIAQLRAAGLPVSLDLVGPAYAPALTSLEAVLLRADPTASFTRYLGPVPRAQLDEHYQRADVCLFASSCENMPNILLEGMASGLPIACSDRGPMPEILGDAGVYFDPEDPADIARAVRSMFESPALRSKLAAASTARVREYSWRRCADETFGFLRQVLAAREGASAGPQSAKIPRG